MATAARAGQGRPMIWMHHTPAFAPECSRQCPFGGLGLVKKFGAVVARAFDCVVSLKAAERPAFPRKIASTNRNCTGYSPAVKIVTFPPILLIPSCGGLTPTSKRSGSRGVTGEPKRKTAAV